MDAYSITRHDKTMDVVVTVPRNFSFRGLKGLAAWIAEGDPAGSAPSGLEWHFYLSNRRPKIEPGERVYVVYNGKLRGYAPLVRIDYDDWTGRYALVRHNDAVALTVPFPIVGFRGFRYRFWDRDSEQPFPDWQIA